MTECVKTKTLYLKGMWSYSFPSTLLQHVHNCSTIPVSSESNSNSIFL